MLEKVMLFEKAVEPVKFSLRAWNTSKGIHDGFKNHNTDHRERWLVSR